MISERYIREWSQTTPWPYSHQVEQDLIISRALCDIYNDPLLKANFAFRGGTALQKIFLPEPARYSEDIDLVQIHPVANGDLVGRIRTCLSWLDEKPQFSNKHGRTTLKFRYKSEIDPVMNMKVKVEINTAESFSALPLKSVPFSVKSEWHTNSCEIVTYHIEEIMATKLRALYQRKKGRDLFDFSSVFAAFPDLDCRRVTEIFDFYMAKGKTPVSRAEFEMAISEKRRDAVYRTDISALLSPGSGEFDMDGAFDELMSRVIRHLSGPEWKGARGPN